MFQLEKLRNKWLNENVVLGPLAKNSDLVFFEKRNGVILPKDLRDYFKNLNGTGGECTLDLFEFYSVSRIQDVKNEFKDWKGIPDYQYLFDKLSGNNLFVFANFQFNLFAYAIQLYSFPNATNEVFTLCGDSFSKVADSFSSFIDLYLNNSIKLQLGA